MDIQLIAGLVVIAIAVVIFIALREVMMWYWKINNLIENQERTIHSQQQTNNLLSEQITLIKRVHKLDHYEENNEN